MNTVKEIHNAFYSDLLNEAITENQKAVLNRIGFTLSPPPEYQKLFPLHKIIHINRVLALCKKYDLLYGELDDYVGTIPARNIKEIESFASNYNLFHVYRYREFGKNIDEKFVKSEDVIKYKKEYQREAIVWRIVASRDLMISKEDAREYSVIHPDPVVLAMIRPDYGSWDSQLEWGVIVTAWGDEAKDESIVNEKMN